jgi:molybdenum cofactor biosynthesis enzyme MoaA
VFKSNKGLNAVNISLDSLVRVKYEFITRRPKTFDAVMRNLNHAISSGFRSQVKVNCVVMRKFNDDELIDFVELSKNQSVDVRFIEYMPFDGNKWKSEKLMTYEQMLKVLRDQYGDSLIPVRENDGRHNATSRPYKVEGYKGQIGFITSMSNDFCSTCNRLRVTADGNLKVS